MTDTPQDSENTPVPTEAKPAADQNVSAAEIFAATVETAANAGIAPAAAGAQTTPTAPEAAATQLQSPAAATQHQAPTAAAEPQATTAAATPLPTAPAPQPVAAATAPLPGAAVTAPQQPAAATAPQQPVAATAPQQPVAATAPQPHPALAGPQPHPSYGNGAFGVPTPTPDYAPYGQQQPYATAPGAKKSGWNPRTGVIIASLAVGALIGGIAGGGIVGIYAATQGASTSAAPTTGAANITVTNPSNATQITAVAAKASPSVVTINVTGANSGGTGSGIILSSDGYVLTNTHVVTLDGQASSVTVQVQDNNGRLYSAKVIGTDPTADLAVIKLNNASGLTPATFADSNKINVGDTAVAIGAPLGLSGTVTDGIVSALNRSISIASSAAPTTTDQGGSSGSPFTFPNGGGGFGGGSQPQAAAPTATISLPVIQTDAPINPGNSGGALLNDKGQVIGVNVAIASASGSSPSGGQSGSIGVGFAIPSDFAQRVAQDLMKNGKATHGLLGASVADAANDPSATTVGAQIKVVTPGGAADKAGLKVGDIVTNFNGVPITSATDLTAQVRVLAGGSSGTLTYVRGNATATVTVNLGTFTGLEVSTDNHHHDRPRSSPAGAIGVCPARPQTPRLISSTDPIRAEQMAHQAAANTLPGVSYVMPVLNEVSHVRAAVDSLLAQDYEGPFEVTLALGPSIDGTTELVEELSAADARIRVVENEIGSTPAGLNIAIRASVYPVIVRVDAHSVLPPDYARIAVETILATGADNVGGLMDAQGTTPFERAVARAYRSRVGLGGTPLHVGGYEGPAETVYLGVFQRERMLEVGLFDEDIKRGQDWELNRRLRASGGTVWFTPRLKVMYRPRPSLNRLARQFVSTGVWRGELARRFPAANGIRYFVPPVMVVGVTAGLILGVIGLILLAVGAAPWLLLGFAIPAFYLVIVIAATIVVTRHDGFRAALWFLIVLPCIHFCWGIGFVLGYLSLTRNITAHTGR